VSIVWRSSFFHPDLKLDATSSSSSDSSTSNLFVDTTTSDMDSSHLQLQQQQREQLLLPPPPNDGYLNREKILLKYRQSAIIFKAFLSKYLRYISSPSRQEGILKTLQYSLWLLSRVYTKFPSSSSSIKDIETERNVVESLATLSNELSWARYVLRFFGFPAALEGIESGSWASSSKWLGKAMAWTMIGYYPLEYLAYLHWKAPKVQWMPISSSSTTVATMWNPFGRSRQRNAAVENYTCPAAGGNSSLTSSEIAAKASAWSCRFWVAFLVLDVARAVMELQRIRKIRQANCVGGVTRNKHDRKTRENGDTGNDDDDDDVATVDEYSSLVRSERLQLARSLLYILPAMNWSLPHCNTRPWLSNDVVNGLCFVESLVGLYQGIRNFQES
jgi:hypothetical protein